MSVLRQILGTKSPFKDQKLGVHWYNSDLYDEDYKVGYVTVFPREQVGGANWQAHAFWNEAPQWFATQEEAKAWLLTMYRLGGGNAVRPRRRPAAK